MNRRLLAFASRGVLAAALAAGVFAATPVLAQKPLGGAGLVSAKAYSYADLIENVSPAVVSINVRSELGGELRGRNFQFEYDGEVPPELQEFFRLFRDRVPEMAPREARSLGSGFFISPQGHVVTNNHVIDKATEITVVLKDGEELKAELIGADPATDLAVLQVAGDKAFPYVKFASEMKLRVGDPVVAVGNPYGLGGSATAGIVSAMGRVGGSYIDFIQIDAPINRGNSGGPTFDIEGRVIGVNSQILSPTGGSIGIGFAIPADTAAKVIDSLIANGKVVRGWLGVQIQSVTDDIADSLGLPEAKGAIVSSVVKGSPADASGFRGGDVVLALDGKPVKDNVELTRRVGDLVAGQKATFKVLRGGKEKTIAVSIGERPSESVLASGALPDDAADAAKSAFGLSLRVASEEDRRRLKIEAGQTAVIIDAVAPNSEAARKGLREGEAIIEVGGDPVATPGAFQAAVDAIAAKGRDAVLLTVVNGQGQRFVALRHNKEG